MKVACFLPLGGHGNGSSAIRNLQGQFCLLQAALCHGYCWTQSCVTASAMAAGMRVSLSASCPVKVSFTHWLMQLWYLKYHHANPEERLLHSYKSSHTKTWTSGLEGMGGGLLALLAHTAVLPSARLHPKVAKSRAHIILVNHIVAIALQCLKIICLN